MSTINASNKNFIQMANKYDRIILLVDMDCFYCQVEEKLNPSLKGKPLAVVQYNAWRGGGIIAVNYAARAKGVTRHMRGDEAKKQCPDIELVKVPSIREKADLTKYRDAGKEVANVLQRFTTLLERASVDEAYLDITDAVNKRIEDMNKGSFELQPKQLLHTYAVGYSGIGEFLTTITSTYQAKDDDSNDGIDIEKNQVSKSNLRLLVGASIASEIRGCVKTDTGYECSAGIAHNKILAKLACGINKPNKQTLLSLNQIPQLFATLPLSKIKGLGGKFGEDIANQLNIRYVGDLIQFTETDLQRKFDEKNGSWLYNICRGIDLEAVTPRFYSKSIGCCKKFPGRNNITGIKTLEHWLTELANEIVERLEKDIEENNRRAKQMVVSFVQEINGEDVSSSRSCQLGAYQSDLLIKNALELIKYNTKQFFRTGSDSILNNPIKFLGLSVGKFESLSVVKGTLQEMFANQLNNKEKQQKIQGTENEIDSNACMKENEKCQHEEYPKKSSDSGNRYLMNALQESKKKQSEQTVTSESYFPQLLRKRPKSPENVQISDSNDKENNTCELDELIHDIQSKDDDTHSNVSKDNENTPSTSSSAVKTDYRSKYAEYAIPQFPKDAINFVKCSICNKNVPDDPVALQMHQDHHLAFQLSEQQRLEYRQEIIGNKSSIGTLNQTVSSGVKRKATKSNTSPSNNKKKIVKPGDITKFLKPETMRPCQKDDNQIICDICNELISKEKEQEHQDFHMAKDLQKQLNQLSVQTVNIKKVNRNEDVHKIPL